MNVGWIMCKQKRRSERLKICCGSLTMKKKKHVLVKWMSMLGHILSVTGFWGNNESSGGVGVCWCDAGIFAWLCSQWGGTLKENFHKPWNTEMYTRLDLDVHIGLIYGLHRSASTLKPLGGNNIDHLLTMQCPAGKPWHWCGCGDLLRSLPLCSSICGKLQDPKSWCQTQCYCWSLHILTIWAYDNGKTKTIIVFMHAVHKPNTKAQTKAFKTHNIQMDVIECDRSLSFTDLMHKQNVLSLPHRIFIYTFILFWSVGLFPMFLLL